VAKTPLKIEQTEPIPGVLLIAASGAILLGPESQRIEDLVRDGLGTGKRIFLFDLTAVTKIDSTGIGRFIAAYNMILKGQGELRIICGPGLVLKSFQVTRLDSVFPIFPALTGAMVNIPK
jgi:anti-sigma B factor antagonist